MYDESLRIPLLVRYPEMIDPGMISGELVQNLDIAPTILDMVGIPLPESFQGESMKPILSGNPVNNWRSAVYYHFFEKGWGVDSHYGIRTDRHKLIHFYSDSGHWELFDLEQDPDEMKNKIDDPDYADVVVRLKEQLYSLQNQYLDTVQYAN